MSVVRGFYRATHSNRCEAWWSFHLLCPLLQMIATDLHVRKLTSYKRTEAGQSLRYSLLRFVNSLGYQGQSQRKVCVLYVWHPYPTRETVMQHLCAACQVKVEAFLPQCPHPFISDSTFNLDCLLAVNHLGSFTILWLCRFLGCRWLYWGLLVLTFLWLTSSFTVVGCHLHLDHQGVAAVFHCYLTFSSLPPGWSGDTPRWRFLSVAIFNYN